MRARQGLSLGFLGIGLLLLAAPWAQSQQAPVREISKIAGEVYRFRNANHYSVFAVTPVGVIATDPINADAARWLKGEISRRFNQPVRYLVYSHDHADHIAGGEVFADTAIVVAHDQAKAVISGERRPTAVPHVTFSDRLTLELGGTVLELAWVGKNHSDNSIVMRFPRERILFAVDFIPVNSFAFRDFPDAYMPDWIESLKRVEAMDFDILAPGHGALGTKANVTMFREYLQDLRAEVLRFAREGKSLEEMKPYRLVQANRRGN
jgi:glyoxylase-like metal-dependent hydrolase (beta-lactamase superfamily II)